VNLQEEPEKELSMPITEVYAELDQQKAMEAIIRVE
jgi:hypothetical protein